MNDSQRLLLVRLSIGVNNCNQPCLNRISFACRRRRLSKLISVPVFYVTVREDSLDFKDSTDFKENIRLPILELVFSRSVDSIEGSWAERDKGLNYFLTNCKIDRRRTRRGEEDGWLPRQTGQGTRRGRRKKRWFAGGKIWSSLN